MSASICAYRAVMIWFFCTIVCCASTSSFAQLSRSARHVDGTEFGVKNGQVEIRRGG